MESRNFENIQYFECQDSLDMIDLLTHLQNPTAGRRVLFSKPYLDGESTCYQIKIISRNIQDEESYNDSEVFKCHVCNIIVPRIYFREHAQSKIHQSFKKISKVVLENIFEHFNIDSDNVISNGAKNTFYCTPCAKTVSVEQKLSHNWSKDHFKSMDKETLFDNFVKMFFDIEPNESERFVETVFSKVVNDEVDSLLTAALLDHQPESRLNLFGNNKAEGKEQNTMQPITVETVFSKVVNDEVDSLLTAASLDHQPESRLNLFGNNIAKKKEQITMQPITVETVFFKVVNDEVDSLLTAASLDHQPESRLNLFGNNKAKRKEQNTMQPITVETVFSKVVNDEVDSPLPGALLKHQPESRLNLFEYNIAKRKEQNTMQLITSVNKKVSQTNEVLTSNTSKINNVLDTTGVDSEIQDFKLYVREMFVKYKLNIGYWILMDDPQYLTASTPNGTILKITVDTFHSFIQLNKMVYCQLCKISMTPDTKRAHIVTEKHVQNIVLPLDNMFCRQINNLWSHDLVRNELIFVGPTTDTTNTEYNTFKGNDTAKVNAVQITEDNKSKRILYCEICDIRVHKNSYVNHTNGKNHKKNEKDNPTKKTASQNSLQHNSQKDKSVKASAASNVRDRNISMDATNFLVYLKDMVLKYNLKYKLPIVKDGSLVVVTPNGFKACVTVDGFHGYKKTESSMYCQLCQMTISNDTRVHSETQIHVKHITQHIDENFSRKISAVMNHCLVCNRTVFDAPEHVATDSNHKSYVQDNFSKTKETEYGFNKKRKLRYCFNDHLNGQRHLKNLNQTSDKDKTSQTNELKKYFNDKYNLIHCNVCDRNIQTNNYEEHCKGKKHKTQIKTNSKRFVKNGKHEVNDVKKETITQQLQYQCEPADKRDTPQNISSQTEVNSYDTNFLIYLKGMVAKFKLNCKLPVVEDDGVVVITPKGYREKFTVDTFHSYKQAKSSVVCQACRMNILSKDTRAHSMTKLHITNILQPVDDNFSRKINKTWSHCLVCNLTVLNSFDHASFSHIHKKNNQADVSHKNQT